jgi:anti-sigma factor RsiW
MMPCASFEDRLLDYAELSTAEREPVDAHLAGCADCREYLDAVAQLDIRLACLYGGARVSPAFQEALVSRVKSEVPLAEPSWLPEILDFIGWAGILAAVVCLASLLPGFTALAALTAAIAIGAAVWAGVRSYADLG